MLEEEIGGFQGNKDGVAEILKGMNVRGLAQGFQRLPVYGENADHFFTP